MTAQISDSCVGVKKVFSRKMWEAPALESPKEIKERLSSFQLEGRIINDLKLAGMTYNLTRDDMESWAYDCLKNIEEERRQLLPDYENIDENIEFYRIAEVDEPFLISFEDGDVFEIEIPMESRFRMSMNQLSWNIAASINQRNVDADVIFSSCLGKKILSVEVKEFADKERVCAIVLWFQDGTNLCLKGWYDFFKVLYFDESQTLGKIAFGELKEGIYNWEDLQIRAQ